jgi:hypothetical protein
MGYGWIWRVFGSLENFHKPYMTEPFLTIIDLWVFVGCCAEHGRMMHF